jgi:sugar phosphate permease
VIADWMPVHERGFAQGTVWTFSRLGGAFVPFLFVWLWNSYGTWTTPFSAMAGLGLLWCAVFWPWFRNRPEEMAQVNAAERELIAAGRPASSRSPEPVPWSRLLGSTNVWALCLMYGSIGFGGNFITNLLPLYLKDFRKLTDEEFSWLSSLPLAFGIASCLLGGWLSDWFIQRTGNRKWGRRLSGAIGAVVASLVVLSVPRVEEVWLLAVVLSVWFFCNDLTMGPAWAACADIGERYAGTLSGAMNMMGSVAGAAGAALAGKLLQMDQAKWVFLVFAGSYGLAALSWLLVDVTKPLVDNPNDAAVGKPAR